MGKPTLIKTTCTACKGTGDERVAKPSRSRIPGEARSDCRACRGKGHHMMPAH